MALIKKMSIRGIRSFSPDDDQVIEFYAPLTMIVGANGCGKTTIIECLKYACTGSLPPDCRKGQYFVHDPKMSDVQEVKASIKLRLKSRGEQLVVVSRSFTLSQKKKSMQFKAQDGTLRSKNDDGQTISVAHKCAEMDKITPSLLGVSKPILDNVIFCHQEDSSWPLAEGAVVKKKFDDIFESARYTKALESIKKLKDGYAGQVKDVKVDIAALSANLKTAQGYKAEYDQAKEKLDALREEIKSYESDIADREEKLNGVRHALQELAELEKKRTNAANAACQMEMLAKEKRSSMTKVLTLSDADLKQRLEAFDEVVDAQRAGIQDLKEEASSAEKALAKSISSRNSLFGEKGALVARVEEQKRLEEDCSIQMANMATLCGITASTKGGVKPFLAELQEHLNSLREKQATEREETRQQEATLTSAVNQAKVHQSTAAAAAAAKKRDLEEAQRERRRLNELLKAAKQSNPEKRANEAKKELEEATESFNKDIDHNRPGAIQTALKVLQKAVASLGVEVTSSGDDLAAARANQRDENEFESMKKSIDLDAEALDERVQAAQSEGGAFWGVLEQPLGQAANEDALNEAETSLRTMKRSVADERKAADLALQASKSLVEDDKRQLAAKAAKKLALEAEKGELQGAVTAVADAIDDVNKNLAEATQQTFGHDALTQVMAFLEKRKNTAMDMASRAKNQRDLLQKSIGIVTSAGDGAANAEHCTCPLCHRGFATQDDMNEFKSRISKEVEELEPKLHQYTGQTKLCTKMIAKLTANRDGWQRYQAIPNALTQLEEQVVEVEQALRGHEAQVKVDKAALAVLEEKVEKVAAARFALNPLRTEMERLNAKRRELGKLERKLQQARAGVTKSLQELEEDHAGFCKQKDAKVEEIQKLNKELHTLDTKLRGLTQRKTDAEREEVDACKGLDRYSELASSHKAVSAKAGALEKEIDDTEGQTSELQVDVRDKEGLLSSYQKQSRERLDELQARVNDALSAVNGLKKSISAAEVLSDFDPQCKLSALEEKLRVVSAQVTSSQKEVSRKKKEILDSEDRINNTASARRGIEENLAYRSAVVSLEEKKEEEKRLGELVDAAKQGEDHDPYVVSQQLTDEIVSLKEARAGKKGQQQSIKEQLLSLKEKLKEDRLRNIDEKFRDAQIDFQTTQMAVKDLDLYHKALDHSLMRYHKIKINEVNKAVNELWQATYQGQDIDMIEIVSGEEGESTQARRSYNYRVKMTKGDATLDMKGRCSAGQRVLASIVIRLALAESFSMHCGILALDEPTTNLDEANKSGLATALAKLITARSSQNNFQMIVITHDEHFLDIMGTALLSNNADEADIAMPEYFFSVAREERGGVWYSTISSAIHQCTKLMSVL